MVRAVLRPVMRSWGLGVLRGLSAVPRPSGDPRVHASGVDSDRILLYGGGPSVGWGVSSYDLALPGWLARAVSSRTRRGTDVDVIADPAAEISNAIGGLRGVLLERYDAVVLSLGQGDVAQLGSVDAWTRHLEELLDYLAERLPPHARVFIVGVHSLTPTTVYDRMVGRLLASQRARVNRASSEAAARRQRAIFIPFDQGYALQSNRYRTPDDYRDAADVIASVVAPALDDAFATTGRTGSTLISIDENTRQRAVDDLHILDTPAEERFDRIVSFAQRAFKTSYAAITIIDRDRQWQKSAVGLERGEVPREFSICATTILQSGALIVEDTEKDDRFPAPPEELGVPPVRFYAGFPIEAPAGERIGALCVLDTNARAATSVDRALLRDLALMVQREVWRGSAA